MLSSWLDAGSRLIELTTTIGGIADLLSLPVIANAETREQAGMALRANLEFALARAARWTYQNLSSVAPNSPPSPQIRRLAGYAIDAQPSIPAALAAWRLIGPTDPGIDGAIARWAQTATRTITSPHTVTQLALQLASADVALLCAASVATTSRALEAGAITASVAAPARRTGTEAGQAWRRAATWPVHLHLGGRSTELRSASSELRQTITSAMRDPRDWKAANELFADSSPDGLLATLHTALQTSIRVGDVVTVALNELRSGRSRVWLESARFPPSAPSVAPTLAAARARWLPDARTLHSGEPLHQAARDALDLLTIAARAALPGAPTTPCTVPGTPVAWEVVEPSGNQLHESQRQAQLTGLTQPRPSRGRSASVPR